MYGEYIIGIIMGIHSPSLLLTRPSAKILCLPFGRLIYHCKVLQRIFLSIIGGLNTTSTITMFWSLGTNGNTLNLGEKHW